MEYVKDFKKKGENFVHLYSDILWMIITVDVDITIWTKLL